MRQNLTSAIDTAKCCFMCAIIVLCGAAGSVSAQTVHIEEAAEEAVERVQRYVRIDTTNPPGNEVRAVDFFARILESEGIKYESAEAAPGRGNIWARLPGGSAPALVLLHHSDVVPADEKYWDVPPLSGVIRDGYIYGRGALDTKTLGIMHLQAFLALHRSGRPLNRDVIFMATADEEAGGFHGAGWLVENRPELFRNVGWLLNEGGTGVLIGDREEFGIEVTQKVPLWLKLVARGTPGHGSTPRVRSSVNRLVRAVYNIQNYEFKPRVIPEVQSYFEGIAKHADPQWRQRYANIHEAIKDSDVLMELQLENPGLHALTRNTCSITILEGSNKINVVPPEASAQLDCRLLPDQDPEAFIAELQSVINDSLIEIEKIMVFTPAVSTTDTDLYRAIVRITKEHFPNATVLPLVQAGFTDSHFFRDLGIVSYGYGPALVPLADRPGVHGNNERISVENVRRGTKILFEILQEVLY